DALLNKKITFSIDSVQKDTSLADLGYSINTAQTVQTAFEVSHNQLLPSQILAYLRITKLTPITLVTSVNHEKLTTFLDALKQEVAQAPKDLSIDYQNNTITTTPAETGITIDQVKAEATILHTISVQQSVDAITLATEPIEPTIKDPSQIADAQSYLTKLLAQ